MKTGHTWRLVQSVVAVVGISVAALAQPTTRPGATEATVVVIPAQGPIQWKLGVDAFEKTMKTATAQKPEAVILRISSPGGVVDYTWSMVSQYRSIQDSKTIAWIDGPENGAFSSGAILALACDKVYIAQGQAIGAAVPYALGNDGLPREVSLKWKSAWHAQVRALCEMKHRPWPVVHALLNAGAGLYRIKTSTGVEYVNYDTLRPMLKPGLVKEMDVLVKEENEKLEGASSSRRSALVTERVFHSDGIPANVEVICQVGDVLTLTAQEAVACGLCDGIADSLSDVLEKAEIQSNSRQVLLRDPLQDSNRQMDGVVRTFLASMEAIGRPVRVGSRGESRSDRGSSAHSTMGSERVLQEYRKVQSLLGRYPDLVTDIETRARIDAAIVRLQASIQQEKAAQREAEKKAEKAEKEARRYR